MYIYIELNNVCFYECMCDIYVVLVFHVSVLRVVLSLSVYLIGWIDRPLLGCSGRPPPGRRDSPGPGGRYRGQGYTGK